MIWQLLPLIMFGLALTSMLMWFIIGTKGHWLIKVVLTFVLCLSGVKIWDTVYVFSGWPTYESLPAKFKFYYAVINEPKKDDPGSIKLWIGANFTTKTLFDNIDKTQPRAYSIPYSKENHKQVQGAMDMVKQGLNVEMSMGDGGGEAGKGNNKAGNGKGGDNDSAESKTDRLFILPPAENPPKPSSNELSLER